MYIKEGTTNYLRLQNNYIVNIYNVSINSYSDNSDSSGRATVIGIDTNSTQMPLAVSTEYNIMRSDMMLNLQQVLDQDLQLSESEKQQILSELAVIVCFSSNFYIDNIDIYSSYSDVTDFNYFFRFINPLYKNIKISNANIGVSGMILYADQQAESTLENLNVDFYRSQGGFFYDMRCSDTSLIFNSTFNVINVNFYFSQARLFSIGYIYNPIRYFGGGKIYYYNFSSSIFTEHTSNRVAVFHFVDESCVFNSGDNPLVNITNAYITIEQQEGRDLSELFATFSAASFTTSISEGASVHVNNMTFENIHTYGTEAFYLNMGPNLDVNIKDLTFQDMYLTEETFEIIDGRNVYLENVSLINSTIDSTQLFVSDAQNLTIKDMTIQGLYGSGSSGLFHVASIQSKIAVNFEDILIDDINLSNFKSFFQFASEEASGNLTFSNMNFSNVVISSPLIVCESTANIEMNDVNFNNIEKQTLNDVSNSMIDLTSVSSSIDRNITLSGISVQYSSMSLVKLSNTAQTVPINQNYSFTNISYMH